MRRGGSKGAGENHYITVIEREFDGLYSVRLINSMKEKTSPWFYYAKPSLSDSERDRLELKLNGTKISPKSCFASLRAWRLGNYFGRLRLLFLDQRQSLLELVKSLQTGNKVTQAFWLFLVPFNFSSSLSLSESERDGFA